MSKQLTEVREVMSFIYDPANGAQPTEITVTEMSHRIYRVSWSDLVIGEWEELFEGLPDALAWVAALTHCGDRRWQIGFSKRDEAFSDAVTVFLDRVTKP
jgi:hypothetical protein